MPSKDETPFKWAAVVNRNLDRKVEVHVMIATASTIATECSYHGRVAYFSFTIQVTFAFGPCILLLVSPLAQNGPVTRNKRDCLKRLHHDSNNKMLNSDK